MDFGKSLLYMVVMLGCFEVSSGTIYKVGDSYGWTSERNFDYKTWASSKHFHLLDKIYFEYDPRVDNVVRVNYWDFRACDATNPIIVMNSGHETILLKSPHSHLYFISGTPGHCQAGQKVDIRLFRGRLHPCPPPPPPSRLVIPAVTPSPAVTPDESSARTRASIHRSTATALVATHICLLECIFIFTLILGF